MGALKARARGFPAVGCLPPANRGTSLPVRLGFFPFRCLLSKQEATESIFVFPEGGECVVFAFFFPFPFLACPVQPEELPKLPVAERGRVGNTGANRDAPGVPSGVSRSYVMERRMSLPDALPLQNSGHGFGVSSPGPASGPPGSPPASPGLPPPGADLAHLAPGHHWCR